MALGMSRTISLFCLLCALVLSGLVSISLPSLKVLPICTTSFGNETVQSAQGLVNDIQDASFGIWGPCFYDSKHDFTCSKAAGITTYVGYTITLTNMDNSHSAAVKSSGTRQLIVLPFATGITFVAFALAPFFQWFIPAILTIVAALLTLGALAGQLVFYSFLKDATSSLGTDIKTLPGPGIWMTLVSSIFLICAGSTLLFCGRDRDSNISISTKDLKKLLKK